MKEENIKDSSQIRIILKTVYLILSMILLTACPSKPQSSLPEDPPNPSQRKKPESSHKITIVDLWEAVKRQNPDLNTILNLIENPKVKKHINNQNPNGQTALSLVVNKKEWVIAEELLKAGASPVLPDGDTILMKYSESGIHNHWHLRKLLEIPSVKAIINARNKNGKTALSMVYKEAISALKRTKKVYDDFIKNKADSSKMQAVITLGTPAIASVEELLKAGANPILPDGDTILMKYSASGAGGVGPLLKIPSVKAIINIQNNKETAFSLAVKAEDWVTMDYLVSYGAKDTTALCSPDRSIPSDPPKSQIYGFRSVNHLVIDKARSYHTALMICSLSGHVEGVNKLLKNPSVRDHINAKNKKKETAFSLAVDGNHWEVMAELARSDANTDYLCSPDNIPDNVSEAELFVNQNKPYNILMICSLSGHVEGVNKLLKNPSVRDHINDQNKDSETAFSLLMDRRYLLGRSQQNMRGRWRVAQRLLFTGADPGLFPEKRSEEIQKIIANTADIYDGTSLMYFSGLGQLDIVNKLLKNQFVRASINTKRLKSILLFHKRETTALLGAVENGHLETMDLLLQAKADPTIPDSKGDTPLMRAAYKGHIEIVRKLLKIPSVKENINDQNEKGETAFFLAKSQGHTEIMELLRSAGASPDITPTNQ